MKKLLLLSTLGYLFFIGNPYCYSQSVGVSGTGSVPDNSALLDVDATGMSPKKGFLVPRMTTTERDAISSPAEALQIFNTTTKCYEGYVNGGWYAIACPAACTPPPAPTANAANSLACTSFTANWSASSGATSYYLDVATDVGFTSFVTGFNNINVNNVTSYSITGLTVNTSYYYRLRAATSCASGNSNTITAITTNVPTGVSASASPNPVCAGSTLTLTGGATNATSWSWSGPGSFTSTSQNPTRASMIAGYAGVYSLTATNACGSATAATTASVTVTAVPTATISYAGTPFCITVGTAQSVILSGTGAYTGGAYGSTAGLSINSGTGAITPSSSTAGTYTVTYTIPASGGCASVPVTTSVTITTLPVATFSYTATPYCSNASNPSPTFSGGGVAGTFSSTAGLNFISTATGQVNLATSTVGAYTVTNTISAAGGCGIVTATSPITINATNAVSVSIAASPSGAICSGTSVTFTATPTNGGGSPSYQWKKNGTNVGTNSTTYTNAGLVNGDAITCVLTSNATCPSGNPATSNTITMTVSSALSAPTAGSHTPSQTQIVWNWNTVSGASGYQWNTTNTYPGAGVNQVGSPTYTKTSLSCGTAYNLYVWAYNASGCYSGVTTLSQTTSSCCAGNMGQACTYTGSYVAYYSCTGTCAAGYGAGWGGGGLNCYSGNGYVYGICYSVPCPDAPGSYAESCSTTGLINGTIQCDGSCQ